MPHPAPLFNASPEWAQVFWVSYLSWSAMEMWIFSRDRRAAKGRSVDRGSFQLLIISIPIGLFGAFACAYGVQGFRIPLPDELVFWPAIVLIWAGMLFRLWAVLTLGRFFRVSVLVLDDHQLITRGPYRFLRNPSYTGGLITMVGIGLAFGSWLSLLSAVGGLMVGYLWRIRVEEKALSQRFGEAWEQYRRKRWALIPPIW